MVRDYYTSDKYIKKIKNGRGEIFLSVVFDIKEYHNKVTLLNYNDVIHVHGSEYVTNAENIKKVRVMNSKLL